MSGGLTDLWDGGSTADWSRLGFEVADGLVTVGSVRIHLGSDVAWSLGESTGPIDGIEAKPATTPAAADLRGSHPNGVTGVDHVVVLTPDLGRTMDALAEAGLELRRTREAGGGRTQAFYWAGPTIVEVVGPVEPPEAKGDPGPATLWGIALTCEDLDQAAAAMGPLLGTPRDAVQPGRRIATVRTSDTDICLAIALMTPHRAS